MPYTIKYTDTTKNDITVNDNTINITDKYCFKV